MRNWYQYFVILLATVSVAQGAYAQQTETPPQEPPFVQEESEFESAPSSEESSLTEEDLLIEEELKSASPEEPQTGTVNLNEQKPSDSNVEEELLFEEEQSVVEEPAVVPVTPAPVQVVRPAPKAAARSEAVGRSKSGGVEYIHHPQAAQGLMTITKDGAYIYRVKPPTATTESGTFRVGMIDPPAIQSADGTSDYGSMYGDSSQAMFMFDYEWKPFNRYGSLGIQAGLGLMYANGQGRFLVADPQFPDQEAKEEYTFLAVPLNLGVVYRLEWADRQWVAPYVSAGGTYVGVVEFRDDGKSPSVLGTPGVYGAGGLLLNITAMSRETAFNLNSEYGINNLWLALEYRQLQTFSEDLDFSSGIMGAGITVDY